MHMQILIDHRSELQMHKYYRAEYLVAIHKDHWTEYAVVNI